MKPKILFTVLTVFVVIICIYFFSLGRREAAATAKAITEKPASPQ